MGQRIIVQNPARFNWHCPGDWQLSFLIVIPSALATGLLGGAEGESGP